MEIRVLSIKKAREELKGYDVNCVKVIITSSYEEDIKYIPQENKLRLQFDDVTKESSHAFNRSLAKEIHEFIDQIDFEKQSLYICCDSGVSRSSAIAAAILRKQKKNEDTIWENCNYHPNLLVYQKLCEEFGIGNTKWNLRRKEKINLQALKKQIKKARKLNNDLQESMWNN